MAEDEPILRGELREIIQRLDERISSLDRNMTDMRADMRADIRQMRHWIFGLYGFILTVAAISIAVTKAL